MDETTAFDLGNPELSELDLVVAGFREQFDGRRWCWRHWSPNRMAIAPSRRSSTITWPPRSPGNAGLCN
jgi:hypothetical protein